MTAKSKWNNLSIANRKFILRNIDEIDSRDKEFLATLRWNETTKSEKEEITEEFSFLEFQEKE